MAIQQNTIAPNLNFGSAPGHSLFSNLDELAWNQPSWAGLTSPSWHEAYSEFSPIDYSWAEGSPIQTKLHWGDLTPGYWAGAPGVNVFSGGSTGGGLLGAFDPSLWTTPYPFTGGLGGEGIVSGEFLTELGVTPGEGRTDASRNIAAGGLSPFKDWLSSAKGVTIQNLFDTAYTGEGGVQKLIGEYYGDVGDLVNQPWGDYSAVLPDSGDYLSKLKSGGTPAPNSILGNYLEKYSGWKDVNLMDPYTDPYFAGDEMSDQIGEGDVGSEVKKFINERKARKEAWFGNEDPYTFNELEQLAGIEEGLTTEDILNKDLTAFTDASTVMGNFANLVKDAQLAKSEEPDIVSFTDPSLTDETVDITKDQLGLIEDIYGTGGTYADPTSAGLVGSAAVGGGYAPQNIIETFYGSGSEGQLPYDMAMAQAEAEQDLADSILEGHEQGASQALFGTAGVTQEQLEELGIIDESGALAGGVNPLDFGPNNTHYEALKTLQANAGGDEYGGTLGAYTLGLEQAESSQSETIQSISDKLNADVRAAGQNVEGTDAAIREAEAKSSGLVIGSARRAKEVMKQDLKDAIEAGFKDKAKGKILSEETYADAIEGASQQFAEAIAGSYGAGGTLASAQTAYDNAVTDINLIKDAAAQDLAYDKTTAFGKGRTPGLDMQWGTSDDEIWDEDLGKFREVTAQDPDSGITSELEYGALPKGIAEMAAGTDGGEYWESVNAYVNQVTDTLGGPGGVAEYDEYAKDATTKWGTLQENLELARDKTEATTDIARSTLAQSIPEIREGGTEHEAYKDFIYGTGGQPGAADAEQQLMLEYLSRFGAPAYGQTGLIAGAAEGTLGYGFMDAVLRPFSGQASGGQNLGALAEEYLSDYVVSDEAVQNYMAPMDQTGTEVFQYQGTVGSCPNGLIPGIQWNEQTNECYNEYTNEVYSPGGTYVVNTDYFGGADPGAETGLPICSMDIYGSVDSNVPCQTQTGDTYCPIGYNQGPCS